MSGAGIRRASRAAAGALVALAVAGGGAIGASSPKSPGDVRASADGGFEALSPGQRLRFHFSRDGVRIAPRPSPSPGWGWGLEYLAPRSGEAPAPEPASRLDPSPDGVEYFRDGIDEWYLVSDRGLEQGFTVEAPGGAEEGSDPSLRVDLAMRGNLSWRLEGDGRSLTLLEPGGSPVLRYGDLNATDADGRDLDAHLELHETSVRRAPDLVIVVDVAEAEFPVTIEARIVSTAGAKPDPERSPGAGSRSAGEGAATRRQGIRTVSGYQLLSAPSNDVCAGAEGIPAGGPFPYLTSVTGDLTDATTSGDPAVPSCQPDVSRSIWYAFTPSLTASYTLSTCASAPTATTVDDTVLAIYTSSGGCGGTFTEIAGGCSDDACAQQSEITATLDAGTTYYVLAWQFGSAAPLAGHTAVQLRVAQRPLVPPANDLCGSAESIPGNGPFPYTTALTSDVTDASTAGDPSGPSCQANVSRSIWYTFTPTATNDYTISTCADAPTGTTVNDTVLAVYTSPGGCGGAFTQLSGACDNDACSFETLQAVVTAHLTGGTTYYVLVWQLGTSAPAAANTAVQLRVTQPGPPSNDVCAGAIPLQLDAPVAGTTALAADDYELSGAGCFGGVGQVASTAPGRDAVYSFTPAAAGEYSVKVTGYSASLNLVSYVASSCPAGSPPVTVGSCLAAANRGTTSTSEEVMCVPLAAGQTAYAFVDENALTAGSPFRIEVNACPREVETNDTPAAANELACGAEGTISPAGEADFFAVGTPAAGSRLFALVDGVASNSTDFDLRATTAADTLEYDDQNDDAPFGSLAPNVAGTPLTGAPAYLRVSQFSSIRIAEPYRLYAAVEPPIGSATPETEPNGTIPQANAAPNGYFYGALSALTDNDVYAFTAAAGDLVLLGLDGDPLRNNTPINAALTLLDASGLPLVAVNDAGSTSSTTSGAGSLTAKNPNSPGEALAYRVSVPGTYYALVTGSTIGDYLLSISAGCRVGPPTDLSVTQIDAPDPVAPTGALAYTVSVANVGAAAATNVRLIDTLPAAATYVSATPSQGSCAGSGPVVCDLGDIAASASATVVVGVTAGASGPLVNTARVASSVTDTNGANDAATESTAVCSGAPAGTPDVSMSPGGLSWTALAGATGYDVVRGGLPALTQSHGNFTTSTEECLANDLPSTSLAYGAAPALGQGFWFLVRGTSCGGSGTYDAGGSQAAGRDAGIAGSAFSCP
ncbi:MAG: DUF11 domain-containing protein [Acidobacteria bacterium]|nr:DUF11 domain-containing protein [Acidobacteriota bacterium]